MGSAWGLHFNIVLYRVSKNVLPLACYNFDTCEQILIFFRRNITDKVSNQKMLYYATSNNFCFCTTLQNGETRKLHFFHSDAVLVQCLNSSSCLISSIFLTHDSYILTLLYDSLNLVINAFISGLLAGMFQDKRT